VEYYPYRSEGPIPYPPALKVWRWRYASTADRLEVYYKDKLMEEMERIHGVGEARIDYRHIIHSLVRKPGAFAPVSV